jgi:hypothetical protein
MYKKIGGEMISVLASSEVYRGFESRSSQIKLKTLKLPFGASPLRPQHLEETTKAVL